MRIERQDRCADEEPLLRDVQGHSVACHYAEDVKAGRIMPKQPQEPAAATL